MSEANGKDILKVGRRGIRKLQYEDGCEVVELDVIHVSNQWAEIDASFRNDKGEVPLDKSQNYFAAQVGFVRELLKIDEKVQVSIADALHFIKLITDETEALKPFFEPKTAAGPSSRSSTEVTFLT